MPKKSITFTCPWCFEDVDSMSLHFRCPKQTSETRDPDFADEPDRLLAAFRQSIGVPAPDLMYKALTRDNPGVRAVTQRIGKTKAWQLTGLRDKYKNTTTERLCPHCHNPLPASCGEANTKIVSIIGYTKIGKTVFLVSLLEWLAQKMHTVLPGARFGFIEGSMGDWFAKRRHELNKGEVVQTPVEYVEPIIGELKLPNGSVLLLSLYDFPGEADVDQMRVLAQKHINKADAWLYLYDLTRTLTWWEAVCLNKIRENKLRLQDPANDAAQREFLETEIANLEWMLKEPGSIPVRDYSGNIEASKYVGAQEWLQQRLENIREKETEKKKRRKEVAKVRPIAVVGTKSDEIANIAEDLLEKVGDAATLKDGIDALRPSSKKLTKQSLEQVHRWMVHNQGLLAGDLDLTDYIGKLSPLSHYFAISSLGCAYKESVGMNGELVKELPIESRDPWRIAEPLLWLIGALNLYSIK